MKSHRIETEESFVLKTVVSSSTRIPVIDGWIQLSAGLRRAPEPQEERAFFQTLGALAARLKKQGLLQCWYYVHKPPGARIRFLAGNTDEKVVSLAAALESAVAGWKWSWLAGVAFDSFFEQRELLSGLPRAEAVRILEHSAETRIRQLQRGRECGVEAWADFTVAFLNQFLGDGWWTWEALGRFERFSSVDARAGHPRITRKLNDPAPLARLLREMKCVSQPDLKAGTAILVTLNYLFNQWGIDAWMRAEIAARARQLVQPEIGKS